GNVDGFPFEELMVGVVRRTQMIHSFMIRLKCYCSHQQEQDSRKVETGC
ncbi:MAG: hypothetical protein ACI8RD_013697, partial [Bacillariaceae sp.]